MVEILVNDWGLDWLARSHRRINVGATRGPFWIVTYSLHGIRAIIIFNFWIFKIGLVVDLTGLPIWIYWSC